MVLFLFLCVCVGGGACVFQNCLFFVTVKVHEKVVELPMKRYRYIIPPKVLTPSNIIVLRISLPLCE